MNLTVHIPTSDMPSKAYFFKRALESLWCQSVQDFEILITDNSTDSVIEDMCNYYGTSIRYIKNPRNLGMAGNTNEGIRRAKGKLIKTLYMDDYMAHEHALAKILRHFSGQWLVTKCTHTINGEDFFNTHEPYYSDDIWTGHNTIGSPSVMTIKNENPLFFDEEMTWVLDCDYYKRMYDKFGAPTILRDTNVIIGIHDEQATNTMGDERKRREIEYIHKKYAKN